MDNEFKTREIYNLNGLEINYIIVAFTLIIVETAIISYILLKTIETITIIRRLNDIVTYTHIFFGEFKFNK